MATTIAVAVKKLGLEMHNAKRSVDFLVIVEKPSEN